MPLVDTEEQRSPPASGEIPLPRRDRHNLQEAYEAYRVFCENGSDRIAWRNLALSLTAYLNSYFRQSGNGRLQVRSDAARVDYLANLGIAQLGYLTKDVLWVLFDSTGFISTEDESRNHFGFNYGFLALTRKYISSLHQYDLEVLLADVTNELNERTPLRNYRNENSVASLPTFWSPKSRTDLGILHYLNVKLSPKDAAILAPFKAKEDSGPKSKIYGLPGRFLRRALSIGAAAPPKRQRSVGRREEKDELFGDADPSRVPRAYTDRLRRVVLQPHIWLPEIPNANILTNPDIDVALPTPEIAVELEPALNTLLPTVTRALSAIREETEEERGTLEDAGGDTSDADSVQSSQTLESLLDFYTQGLRSQNASTKSVLDSEKRVSLDVAELNEPKIQERLSLAKKLFDEAASLGKASDRSALSEHPSFITARTRVSVKAPRISAQSSVESFVSLDTASSSNEDPMVRSSYQEMLNIRGLIPPPTLETDWSGRGQHAEFTPKEHDAIPLQVEKLLGQTRNAVVESVRCKRIRLVRKIMHCTKWSGLKREDALREVQHLYRIQHSHIVRLVGTYVTGADLAILTYPCAEWSLDQFLRTSPGALDAVDRCASLRKFFTCVAKVLDFMHSFPLKHMDIKPQNLLVRDIRNSAVNDSIPYKVYFTDFGISRSYESVEESETETPTSFTRTYAAREVVLQEPRGLSADIFSLGCVYAEMLATILDTSKPESDQCPDRDATPHWDSLLEARGRMGTALRPYHSSVDDVRAWLAALTLHEQELQAVRDWTMQMIDTDPIKRPNAHKIAEDPHLPFPCLSCTLRAGPEDFEAVEPVAPLDDPPHTPRVSVEVPKPP
ncbi:kinase-like protein [Trematosphaeria pertusa]|uniref:Kinase-like protein n=1 Tax=Trematosphaeria pertusa TaxID=390896 RepID=A0A6A6IHJ9_9PLEO|nr:kinase-like protein [Trematosphaeria pertusa]KAF2249647.1 kinase-like protein [Trematosphaeria pertusa]